MLFFTLNREDFSFVIHLDRQPRTSRRREAQTGSRARSGSRSERTLDAVEHSRTLMEWWPFLIFHRGGLRIKVINNTTSSRSPSSVVGNRYRETSEFQGLAQSDLSHLIAAASYCFAVFFAFSAALASRTFAFSAALALASRTFSHARTSRRRN